MPMVVVEIFRRAYTDVVNASKLMSFVLIAVLTYGQVVASAHIAEHVHDVSSDVTNCLLQNGCSDINKLAVAWSPDAHDHNHAESVDTDHHEDFNCAIYHAYLSANGIEGSAEHEFPASLVPAVGSFYHRDFLGVDFKKIRSIRAPPVVS